MEALSDVYIRQARRAIEQKDFPSAESCLLRANRPELILRYYKESGMWQDAIRIAKDYMPAELRHIEVSDYFTISYPTNRWIDICCFFEKFLCSMKFH